MELEERGIELGAGCTFVAMILFLFSRWYNPTENAGSWIAGPRVTAQ